MLQSQRGWANNSIYYKSHPTNSSLLEVISIIDIIDMGLQKNSLCTPNMFVVYQTCWNLWIHRNDRMFNKRQHTFSPRGMATQAIVNLEAASKYTKSHKKHHRMRLAITLIRPHWERC